MNKSLAFAFGTVIGFGVGFIGCRSYFDRKYREIADAEIASVMERSGRKIPGSDAEKNDGSPANKPHILRESIDPNMKRENRALISKLGYSNQPEPDQAPTDMDPYVIDPEDYDTKEDYDTCNLTYFADGVVVDDMDHQLSSDEIEAAIGMDSLDHFGEYEDDSVHVRNDHRKMDYEILKDERTYTEAMRFRPHMEEDD